MKVIFLDVDGVLNNFASIAEHVHIMPEKCLLIRRILEETGARIVVSSTWRIGRTIKELNMMFWPVGIPYKVVYGMTEELSGIRGLEIEAWLKEHDYVSKYVIIDDDSDFLEYQKSNFFQTHMKSGLTTKTTKEIIKHLNA